MHSSGKRSFQGHWSLPWTVYRLDSVHFLHARTHTHTSCYITTGSCEAHTSAMPACKKWEAVSRAATPLQTLSRSLFLPPFIANRSSGDLNTLKTTLAFPSCGFGSESSEPVAVRISSVFGNADQKGSRQHGSQKQSAGWKVLHAFPFLCRGKTARKLQFLAILFINKPRWRHKWM